MFAGATNRGLIVGILAVVVSATCQIPTGMAEEAGGKAIYYVDFRARTAATNGHAFVWYGRIDRKEVEVAGLHPATDNPIPYIIGQIFPVPSETGKSYGDLDEAYLLASYRVAMTEAQAKPVFAYIKHLQATSPVWNGALYNCISFIQDIAREMGLKVPNQHILMPDEWVEKLRRLNGGRNNQVVSLSNILAGTVPKSGEADSAAAKPAASKPAATKRAELPTNQSASAVTNINY